jgi:hypothetical protein
MSTPNQPYQPYQPQAPFQSPAPAKPKGKGCLVAVLIVVALLVLGAIVSALNGGGSKAAPGTNSTMQPANQTTAAATSQAPTDATDPTTLSNNGWQITTFNMKPDGAGSFGAVARIVNGTGSDKKGAIFTMTVLDASKNIVATLIGIASTVAKDATVTVQFSSTDPYKAGTYLYAFQVDAAY